VTKKSSSKEPFLPFFVGDFMAATGEWEGEARALYALLLLHQWALGSIPAEPRRVCKLAGWDQDVFNLHWRTVRRKFEVVILPSNDGGDDEERLVNPRLEEHRDKTRELSEKNSASGRKGAENRWRKNGERHSKSVANATNTDSERHTKRHRKTHGATDGNPSHPIPSHPDPSNPSQTTASVRYSKSEVEPKNSTLQGERADASANPTKRGARVPIPFPITDEMRAWALAEVPGVNLDKGTTEFVDYWKAVPGHKGCKLDWIATWRNRMRTLHERSTNRTQSLNAARTGFAAEWDRVKDEAASEGFRQPERNETIEQFRHALKLHVNGETQRAIERGKTIGVDIANAAKTMQ
jgi:uncharacterized protein YdaU (DUF1376 family)